MRKWIWLAVFVLAALYVAYPYFTISRIQAAIDARDPIALDVYVDWPAVRAGVKSDLQAEVAQRLGTGQGSGDDKIGAQIGTALATMVIPAVLDKVVDVFVSSKSLFKAADVLDPDRTRKPRLWDYITYAFFASPTDFRIDLKNPEKPEGSRISALMSFAGGKWRVTRIRLPVAASDFPELSGSGN